MKYEIFVELSQKERLKSFLEEKYPKFVKIFPVEKRSVLLGYSAFVEERNPLPFLSEDFIAGVSSRG